MREPRSSVGVRPQALHHPDPQVRGFWDFQMLQELIEGFGYPELTSPIKRKILGESFAPMHGIDIIDIEEQGRDRRR